MEEQKWIELTQESGRKIFLNPSQICAVHEGGDEDYVSIEMSKGSILVKEKYDEVVNALRSQRY
jgi:uncharacterized protein YlzI (FlbEa/FlbD family)